MDRELALFYRLYRRRRSVRSCLKRQVEEEKLERLLEILRCAQSAANCQPWHFIVLKGEDKEKLNPHIFTKQGFMDAPVAIVACAEPEAAWTRKADSKNYAWVDVTIAITEMIGAATAEGLGTCWIAAIEPQRVKELLGIPANIDVVAIIVMGYPDRELRVEEKDRKPLSEIVHWGRW